MESAAYYNAKLKDIARECQNNSEYAKRDDYRFGVAIEHLNLGVQALEVPPIGGGMTSVALSAVAETQEEIKNTIRTNAAWPAAVSVAEAQQSFSKL